MKLRKNQIANFSIVATYIANHIKEDNSCTITFHHFHYGGKTIAYLAIRNLIQKMHDHGLLTYVPNHKYVKRNGKKVFVRLHFKATRLRDIDMGKIYEVFEQYKTEFAEYNAGLRRG